MKSTRYFCWTLVELEFSRQTFKNKPLVSNFIKILPVEAEIFYEDGQTDMKKLIIASRFSTSHHLTFFPSKALRCLQPTLTGKDKRALPDGNLWRCTLSVLPLSCSIFKRALLQRYNGFVLRTYSLSALTMILIGRINVCTRRGCSEFSAQRRRLPLRSPYLYMLGKKI